MSLVSTTMKRDKRSGEFLFFLFPPPPFFSLNPDSFFSSDRCDQFTNSFFSFIYHPVPSRSLPLLFLHLSSTLANDARVVNSATPLAHSHSTLVASLASLEDTRRMMEFKFQIQPPLSLSQQRHAMPALLVGAEKHLDRHFVCRAVLGS